MNGDARLGEILHDLPRRLHVFGQALPQLSMIAEGVQGRGRHSVYRVFPNQLFDVHHIPIAGIFCARAGPQYALGLRTLRRQGLPTRSTEDSQIELIGELPIRDSNLAQQALRQCLLLRIRSFLQRIANDGIHQRVNPADEETGHAGHLADVPTAGRKLFQARNVSLSNLLVNFLCEQESDVDVDSFADQLLKGGNAFRRAGHFDHDVRASHRTPQAARFFDGASSVPRQVRRYLQADVTVSTLRAFVHGAQDVSGFLDVANGQQLVACFGIQVGAGIQGSQKVRVIGARRDSLLKNRRVRRHPLEPIFFYQAF